MKRIPLYRYVAHNNPRGAMEVIEHFKLPRPKNRQQAMKALRFVMVKFKDEGLMQLAKHHPDRKLILAEYELSNPPPEVTPPADIPVRVVEETLSACGCSQANGKSSACGGAHSNCGGCAAAANGAKSTESAPAAKETEKAAEKAVDGTKEFVSDTLPYLALGVVIIGLTLAVVSPKIAK